jgi:hypothetical protein
MILALPPHTTRPAAADRPTAPAADSRSARSAGANRPVEPTVAELREELRALGRRIDLLTEEVRAPHRAPRGRRARSRRRSAPVGAARAARERHEELVLAHLLRSGQLARG